MKFLPSVPQLLPGTFPVTESMAISTSQWKSHSGMLPAGFAAETELPSGDAFLNSELRVTQA